MSAFDEYMAAKEAGTHSEDELDALRAAAKDELRTEQDAIDAWESRQADMLKPGPTEDDPIEFGPDDQILDYRHALRQLLDEDPDWEPPLA
jgi:hypothetical protein